MLGVFQAENKLIVGFEELREEYKTIIRQIVGEEIPIKFEEGRIVLDRKDRSVPSFALRTIGVH
jgi:hypothetical protein